MTIKYVNLFHEHCFPQLIPGGNDGQKKETVDLTV